MLIAVRSRSNNLNLKKSKQKLFIPLKRKARKKKVKPNCQKNKLQMKNSLSGKVVVGAIAPQTRSVMVTVSIAVIQAVARKKGEEGRSIRKVRR